MANLFQMARTVALSCAFALPAGLSLADAKKVYWQDLMVAAEPIENPFAKLETEQLQRLARLLRYETEQPGVLDVEIKEEIKTLRSGLAAEGLDVDWLFEQRLIIMAANEKANTQPNEELVGKEIKLAGYVLPLEFNGLRATEFLLVPTVGACIHVPPPPANQMVYVTYPKGVELTGLYDPVWIEGPLESEILNHDITYSDGAGEVTVSYKMVADSVLEYSQ
ncbi:DUF3299 domain-containing protein [Shimia sp. SDUM112013]|uniref:DUF3299 domain-containing protein n=1 Tax=Shimia sp. SDUM112013 TaxID=3136160 RepID=UPI0032EB90C5